MSGFNLSAWALRNRPLVVYFMLAATLAGIFAYVKLGRNEDPPFTIRTMIVQALWPGATLDETLLQVTERIERKLQEIDSIDVLRSYTKAGLAVIFVDLVDALPAADIPLTWQRVRNDVGDIWHRLPQGVVGPFFNDRFGDVFGTIYGFTADGFTHRELRDHVEHIRSELLKIPDVSIVEMIGAQDEVIFVEFSTQELATRGIDRRELLAALATQNAVRPAGVIHTGDENISIRVTGAFDSEQDLLDINFVAGGRLVPLSDIAEVRRGYADPPQPMFRVNGKPAIGLGIAMRDGGDILALGQNLRQRMAELTVDLPIGIEPFLVADQSIVVDLAIAEFMESLWQAIGIILVVSFLSLGVRPGLVVAFAIPLTMAVVFSLMQATGIDMQRISLGALIIALALLVDDAMTTTDATLRRLAAGDERALAAQYAFDKYAFAMLAGTLVTIAGFIPVGFARSSAGEYTFSLFAVVTMALLVSWLVAVLFTPLMNVLVLRPPKREQPADAAPTGIEAAYRGLLTLALRLRWVTIAATVGLFVLAILLMPLIPRQFFPSSDRPELVVDLTLPQQASIFASADVAARFDAGLAGDPDVASWSTYVGRGAIRFYLPLNVQLANDFFSQVVIVAKDVAARERLRARLEERLTREFPELIARIYPLELGPPVGWPVQYRVLGPDPSRVREIAFDLAQVVARSPKAEKVHFDWIEPARQVRVRIDQNEARRLGLSSEALAGVLNTIVTGAPVTQVRDDIYLINVVARATQEQRVSLTTLPLVQVATPSGRTVPLSQIATFEYDQELPLLWRRNRVPTLTVQADVVRGHLPEAVVDELAPDIAELARTLPRDYRIETGGTVEESQQSQASVAAVVPAMLLIMLTVLMFQLRSFQRLVLVLMVAPLGLIGVVAALLPSGRPLGFVAILGMLALVGMITKNTVILLGQIEDERAAGKPVRAAVIDACTVRFRPIMLTAVSTVLGMIPIAFTVFWGPMAFAIAGGLLVATLLTLIFFPAAYVAWFERQEARAAVATRAAA